MAYAPHTNSPDMTAPRILGRFTGCEYGTTFEYAQRPADDTTFAPEYPHLVYVGQNTKRDFRYARVLGTVAHVVIDEGADGEPVIEKWQIKQHSRYA